MIPVKQTRIGYPGGNCFAACVASVFEVPLESLPDLPMEKWASDELWWKTWMDWLAERNCGLVVLHGQTPPGYVLAGGKSPRGDFDHQVVALNGNIVHDPYPDNAGLDGEIKDWTIFYPLDPSKPIGVKG